MASRLLAAAVLLHATSCPRVLGPELQKPAKLPPSLSEPPPAPAPGRGQVAFDTDREGSEVMLGDTRLCVTPCVANVPLGAHLVSIEHGYDDDGAQLTTDGFQILSSEHPSVVRANVGRMKRPRVGMLAGGTVSLIFGGALMLTGAVVTDGDSPKVGVPRFLVGAGLATLGGVLLHRGRMQIQRSATVQFAPANGVIYQTQ